MRSEYVYMENGVAYECLNCHCRIILNQFKTGDCECSFPTVNRDTLWKENKMEKMYCDKCQEEIKEIDAKVFTGRLGFLDIQSKERKEFLEKNRSLIEHARQGQRKAFAKVSGYMVGAAIRDNFTGLYVGSNVETDIHHSNHAEMLAIQRMITVFPERKIKEIIVMCPDDAWFPCGWCRQWIWEYAENEDTRVIAVNTDLTQIKVATIGQLLPFGFKRDR